MLAVNITRQLWLINMLTFRKLRSIVIKVWLPALISISLIISTTLISDASISPIPLPKSPKIGQQQEIKIIYQALADDIVQIFKWMETPGITPVELGVKILGYKSDSDRVNLSPQLSYPGLPSFRHEKYQKYRENTTFSKYLYGKSLYISGFLRSPQDKIEISDVQIYPLNLNSLNIGKINKNWYDNFSSIKFMEHLSDGEIEIEKEEGFSEHPHLNQTIDIKQKHFKSSQHQKYVVGITSSPTGAWRGSNGEELLRQRKPFITLQLDPKQA